LVQRMAVRAAEVASEAVEAPTPVEAVEAENLGNKAEKLVKLKSSDDEVIKVGVATETELEDKVEDISVKHITVFFGT
jgi:hypothetical protein